MHRTTSKVCILYRDHTLISDLIREEGHFSPNDYNLVTHFRRGGGGCEQINYIIIGEVGPLLKILFRHLPWRGFENGQCWRK